MLHLVEAVHRRAKASVVPAPRTQPSSDRRSGCDLRQTLQIVNVRQHQRPRQRAVRTGAYRKPGSQGLCFVHLFLCFVHLFL